MNFDFMMECEIKDPKIKAAYDEIYKELCLLYTSELPTNSRV